MNFMSYNEKNGNYAFLDQLMTKEVEMNKVCLKKKNVACFGSLLPENWSWLMLKHSV